jgi:hypothetical protein
LLKHHSTMEMQQIIEMLADRKADHAKADAKQD